MMMQLKHLTNQSGSVIDETIGEHNRVSGSDYVFFVSGTIEDLGAVDVNFANVPASTNRGDFEDRDLELTTLVVLQEVVLYLIFQKSTLELKSEAIVAKTRKLKAVWTLS